VTFIGLATLNSQLKRSITPDDYLQPYAVDTIHALLTLYLRHGIFRISSPPSRDGHSPHLAPPCLVNNPNRNNRSSPNLECGRNTTVPSHQQKRHYVISLLEPAEQSTPGVKNIERINTSYKNCATFLKYVGKLLARRLTVWPCYACLFRTQFSGSF
jgi:hypothetical protein